MFSSLLLTCALLGQDKPSNDGAAPAATAKPAETAPPAEAKKDELAAEVHKLVKQLDAGELAAREEAEKKLLELGAVVLNLLPQPTNRTSAEVKERLGRIRDKLQRAEAEGALLSSTVTLKADKTKLSEVLKTIEEQTGNKVVDYREQFGQEARDPAVTIELDKTPFWPALDQVLDEAGSTLYSYADEAAEALGVIDRPDMELPRGKRQVAYAGPFRIEAQQWEATRSLLNPEGTSLVLSLDVAWEPRLLPINLEQNPKDLSATDESGKSLEISGEEALDVPIQAETHSVEVRVPFTLPPRSVQKIASLKGKFTALVPGRMEMFTFDDVKKPKQEQRRAGVAVILDQTRKNGDTWEVRVRVRFDEASDALESHRGWIYNNIAYLVGPDKKSIQPDSMETTRQTEDEVGVAYLFGLEKGISGHSFVYKTPSVIVTLPVEYELKDLELP